MVGEAENSDNKVKVADDTLAEWRAVVKRHWKFRALVQSRTWVQVTHVNSPNDFYVRPICTSNEYLKSIEKKSSRTDFTPEANSLVLYKRGSKWIRGRILFMLEASNSCKISALDYGFEDIVPLGDDICRLAELSALIPRLSYKCSAVECYTLEDHWEDNAKEAFRTLVQKGPCNVENMNYNITNINVKFHYPHVSMIMYSCGYASMFGIPCSVNVHSPMICTPQKQYYDHLKVKVGDTVHVTYLSEADSKSFYAAEVDMYRKHLDGVERFNEESKSFRKLYNKEVTKNRPVCYSEGGSAYRARIFPVVTSSYKVNVRLVDSGRIVKAKLNQLYHLDESYLNEPAVTIYCVTEDDFSSFSPGDEFDITIKEVGDKFTEPHVVTISKS